MDFSLWFNHINFGIVHCKYLYQGVEVYKFQIKIVFLSMTIVFVLANSVDPDEMLS